MSDRQDKIAAGRAKWNEEKARRKNEADRASLESTSSKTSNDRLSSESRDALLLQPPPPSSSTTTSSSSTGITATSQTSAPSYASKSGEIEKITQALGIGPSHPLFETIQHIVQNVDVDVSSMLAGKQLPTEGSPKELYVSLLKDAYIDIANLKSRIVQLKDEELDLAQSEWIEESRRLSMLMRETLDKDVTIEELRMKLTASLDDGERLRKRIGQMENRLKELTPFEAKSKSLSDLVSNLEKKNEALSKDIMSLHVTVEKLTEEKKETERFFRGESQKQQDIALALKQECTALREEKEKLQGEQHILLEDLSRAEKDKSRIAQDKERAKAELEELIAALRQEKALLIEQFTADKHHLKNDVDSVNSENEVLKHQADSVKNQLREALTALNQKNAEIKVLQANMSNFSQERVDQLDLLKKKLQAAIDERDAVLQDAAAVSQQCQTLTVQVHHADAEKIALLASVDELQSLRSNVQSLQDAVASATMQLQDAQKERESLSSEVHRLRAEVESVTLASVELQSKLDAAVHDRESALSELAHMKKDHLASVNAKDSEISDLLAQNASLLSSGQNSLVSVSEMLQSVTAERDGLLETSHQLSATISELKQQLTELSSSHESNLQQWRSREATAAERLAVAIQSLQNAELLSASLKSERDQALHTLAEERTSFATQMEQQSVDVKNALSNASQLSAEKQTLIQQVGVLQGIINTFEISKDSTVTNLSRERDEVVERIKELHKDLELVTQDRDAHHHRFSEALVELEAMRDDLSQKTKVFESELAELADLRSTLSDERASHFRIVEEFESKIESLKRENETLTETLESAEEEHRELQEVVEVVRETQENLAVQNTENFNLRQSLSRLQDELSALRPLVHSKDQQLSTALTRCESLESQLKMLESETESGHVRLVQDLAAATEEKSKLQLEGSQLSKTVQESCALVCERILHPLREILDRTAASESREPLSIQEAIIAAAVLCDELSVVFTFNKSRAAQLCDEISAVQNNLSQTQALLADSEREVQNLHHQLQQASSEMQKSSTALMQAQERESLAAAELKLLQEGAVLNQEQIAAVSARLEFQQQRRVELEAERNAADEDRRALSAENERLKQESSKQHSEFTSVTDANLDLRDKLLAAEMEGSSWKQRFEEIEGQRKQEAAALVEARSLLSFHADQKEVLAVAQECMLKSLQDQYQCALVEKELLTSSSDELRATLDVERAERIQLAQNFTVVRQEYMQTMERLQALELRNSQLEEEMSRLKYDLLKANADLSFSSRTQAAVDSLTEQLSVTSREAQSLLEELQLHKNRLQSAASALESSQLENQRLLKSLSEVQESSSLASVSLHEAVSQRDLAIQKEQLCVLRILDLERELASNHASMESTSSLLRDSQSRIAVLISQVKEQEATGSHVRAEDDVTSTSDSTIDTLMHNLESQEQRVQELEADLERKQEIILRLEEDLSDLASRVKNGQSHAAEVERRLAEKDSVLVDVQAEREALLLRLAAMQETVDALQHDIGQRKKEDEAAAISETVVVLKEMNNQLDAKLSKLAGEKQDVERHLRSAVETIREFESHNRSLAEQLEDARQQLADAIAQNIHIAMELAESHGEVTGFTRIDTSMSTSPMASGYVDIAVGTPKPLLVSNVSLQSTNEHMVLMLERKLSAAMDQIRERDSHILILKDQISDLRDQQAHLIEDSVHISRELDAQRSVFERSTSPMVSAASGFPSAANGRGELVDEDAAREIEGKECINFQEEEHALESALRSLQQAYASLREENSRLELVKVEQTAWISQLEMRLRECAKEISEKESHLSNLRSSYEDTISRVASLEDEYRAFRKSGSQEEAELKRRLALSEEEMKSLRGTHAATVRDLNTARTQIECYREEIGHVMKELSVALAERDSLRSEYEHRDREREQRTLHEKRQLEESNQVLRQECDTARKVAAELESEIRHLVRVGHTQRSEDAKDQQLAYIKDMNRALVEQKNLMRNLLSPRLYRLLYQPGKGFMVGLEMSDLSAFPGGRGRASKASRFWKHAFTMVLCIVRLRRLAVLRRSHPIPFVMPQQQPMPQPHAHVPLHNREAEIASYVSSLKKLLKQKDEELTMLKTHLSTSNTAGLGVPAPSFNPSGSFSASSGPLRGGSGVLPLEALRTEYRVLAEKARQLRSDLESSQMRENAEKRARIRIEQELEAACKRIREEESKSADWRREYEQALKRLEEERRVGVYMASSAGRSFGASGVAMTGMAAAADLRPSAVSPERENRHLYSGASGVVRSNYRRY
eukprot:ANDGO_06928.mRNA.1 hypothetical protein